MKSIKYILISLIAAFAISLKSVACGPYPWYSDQITYSCFKIFDGDPDDYGFSYDDIYDKNIIEWQQMVGKNINYLDIKEVVYDFSINQLEQILSEQTNYLNLILENSFAKLLRKNRDSEIVNYLLLAKRCEQSRPKLFKSSDKWWYPNKEDLKTGNELQSIIDEAMAYKGKRLKNRYLLQALRAACTMENYELCFSLWKKEISKLPNSEVKKMSAGYIGKIFFQQKNYKEAIKYYALTDDYNSFFWCIENMAYEDKEPKIKHTKLLHEYKSMVNNMINNKKWGDIECIKMLNKYKPSSPELAKMVQIICREAEERANMKDYNEYKQKYIPNRKRYIELRDFALKAAEKRSDNQAMWQYTAAFLTFIDGNATLANEYLEQASEMRGSPFIKENINRFKMLANSHTAAQVDSLFESLLPELKELDSVKSLPFEKYSENIFPDIYNKPTLWWYYNQAEENSIKNNEMSKITPAHLIPKYLKLKDYTKVLLLAMAANNWTVSCKIQYPEWFSIYGTDVYFWMDVVPVENLIEFQQLYNTGGRNEFEQFLLTRFRIDKDFLNELIGTKYLRTMQFDKAIPYLSKVSNNYIQKMNIYEYFNIDPFQKEIYKRSFEKPYPTYKLNYAKKMLALKTEILNTRNADKKADKMLQYALALKRSTPLGEAWALTDYYSGVNYSYNYNNLRKVIKDEWKKNLIKESNKYLEQAELLAKNPEIKSQCYFTKNYFFYDNSGYKNNGLNNENFYCLIKKYAETQLVKEFMSECDKFSSYYNDEYKINAWAYNPEKNK